MLVTVDYENNAEEWWTALREWRDAHENKTPAHPMFDSVGRLIADGELTVDEDHEGRFLEFVDFVSSLPGWNTGPRYAKYPLAFTPITAAEGKEA